MSLPERRFGPGRGLTVGGIVVVLGILSFLFISIWLGLIIVLVGLIGFGGFVRGKWY